MNSIRHKKHAAAQNWFEELAKQAHIATTPAPPVSETNLQNPTKPLAADLLLIFISLKEPGRDGQTVAINFSVVRISGGGIILQTIGERATSCCCTSRGNKDFQIRPCLQGNGQHSL